MVADNTTPFYERTLDSFSDAVITSARQGNDSTLWYAVLDWGARSYPSDADFSTCASTREEAVALCAAKIRDDQKGIGKYAPHDLDMWRLCEHWVSKERT